MQKYIEKYSPYSMQKIFKLRYFKFTQNHKNLYTLDLKFDLQLPCIAFCKFD